THDQVTGGTSAQVFEGCRFPADAAYRREIQAAGCRAAEVLRGRGVLGRFATKKPALRAAQRPGRNWPGPSQQGERSRAAGPASAGRAPASGNVHAARVERSRVQTVLPELLGDNALDARGPLRSMLNRRAAVRQASV
ncbi:MAG: hypothetical protein AAF790_01560, partial [Planctomycetota bacterium]